VRRRGPRAAGKSYVLGLQGAAPREEELRQLDPIHLDASMHTLDTATTATSERRRLQPLNQDLLISG